MKFFHIFLLLLVVAIWGMNFVSVKIALDAMPPLLVCFVRFFLTSMPAVFFFKRPAVPFGWIVVYGLLMFVLQFALIFSGMKAGLSPGLSSILLQTQVFFSILFGSMILKEQVTRWQNIGALISFIEARPLVKAGEVAKALLAAGGGALAEGTEPTPEQRERLAAGSAAIA